jgi:hypothetical protein
LVAVAVVATVIGNNIGLVNSFAILIPQSFALQSLLLWAALVVIAIYACRSLVALVRRKWFVRGMRSRVLTCLQLWNQLGEAYSKNNTEKINEMTSKLMILYTPIAPYIRSQAKASVGLPLSNIRIENFDIIGNLLIGAITQYGFTVEQAYDRGRMILLAALGSLGYRPE